MWQVASETRTVAPPAAVWALWDDAARWPQWNRQIATAELLGPFRQGTKARVRFKRQPRPLTFEITEIEHGRVFVDETRLPGARLGHEHRIDQQDGATVIVHRLYFDGPLAPLWALLMGRQMRKAVASFGEMERTLAELQ